MDNKTLEELIEELRTLRIRETAVIAQIEKWVNGKHKRHRREPTGSNCQRNKPRRSGPHQEQNTKADRWTRVELTKEHLATVTRITTDQVHIATERPK
jgi:hypothetical protein